MKKTKEIIIDAFWQLLEEKPFNKITVQNIVERCALNRNTLIIPLELITHSD